MNDVPIVLVEINENSRVRILQTDGVRVGFVDRRVDGNHLTILPERDQWFEINAAIADLDIMSIARDDPVKTALNTLLRLARGKIITVGVVDEEPDVSGR